MNSATQVDQEVRRLWSTGRYEDIRVETDAAGKPVYRLVPAPDLRLRKIQIEPPSYPLKLSMPEGTFLSRMLAHEVAAEARKQLLARGYAEPQVDWSFVPCGRHTADLKLTVKAGDRVRVKQLEFIGDPAIDPHEFRHSVQVLKIGRSYDEQSAQADVARVLSFYMSKGYFDARVRLDDVQIEGKEARLRVDVQSGPLYPDGAVRAAALCSNLFAERRGAERQGILDFSATFHTADFTTEIERGPSLHIGRIDFYGNHRTKDATIRRNLLLDEGALFDSYQLRKSLTRLNQSNLFEPLDERSVAIQTDERTGLANIKIKFKERKRGSWSFSGPVGPISFAGPPEGAVSFRFGGFTISFGVAAFLSPITPLQFTPVISIARPFSPAEGLWSGFTIAPQLGWQAMLTGYAAAQLKHRLVPVLLGNRALTPELPVTVDRRAGDATLMCEPPQPHLIKVRRIVAFPLGVL